MGKLFSRFKTLPFGKMGVGQVLTSIAFESTTQFYPLTKYDFISVGWARLLFWFFVVLGILGIIFIIIAIIRRKMEDEETKRILIEKLKIKQDVSNADEVNGLK